MNMRFTICVSVICLVITFPVITAELDLEWEAFKTLYRKRYADPKEEAYRQNIWKDNGRYIESHNKAAAEGKFPYTLKQTQLSDHTHEEILKSLTNGNPNRQPPSYYELCERRNPTVIPTFNPQELPQEIDYRTTNCLPNVKDQRQLECGSCWAFGVTSAVEFMNCYKRKSYTRLSEQQLVDCSWNHGNHGCNGGFHNTSLDYLINYGQQSEESYPYVARDQPCRFNPLYVTAVIEGYKMWPCNDELLMKYVLATHGPIIVTFYAKGDFFWLADGVLDYVDCPLYDANHIVTIVGYGTSKEGIDYWLIRNSFGAFWGVHGYGKLRRGVNFCSIAMLPITVEVS